MLAVASFTIASPAGAIVNGCAAPGGISQFPNAPGGQSNLKVACTTTTATGSTSQFYKTEDFPQAVWHVGAGRVVTGNATSGNATITLTAGTLTAADVNHTISGYSASTPLNGTAASGIPAFAFIKTVNSATSATLDIPANATVTAKKWTIDNSDSRAVKDGHVTVSTTGLTSATANFKPTDAGRAITGTDLAHGTTIASVTNATTVVLSKAATATSTTEQVTIGTAANQTTARFVHDVHTTSASTTITSASASFQSWDVNLPVVGTNIPAGDYIASVTNATTAVLHAAASGTTTTGSLSIGGPSATAPANNDTALNLGAELALQPSLVAGSPPCTANVPTGFDITGAWENPNAYAAASLGSSTDPSLTRPTVGQFLVPTAVITFAGYVMQMPAASGDTDTAAHYDVVFPFLPTGLAVCSTPSTVGIASTFSFLATLHSQGAVPSGTGTPNTVQTRSLKDITTATVSSSAILHIRTNSSSTTDNFTFTQACTEQYPDIADFGCGIG